MSLKTTARMRIILTLPSTPSIHSLASTVGRVQPARHAVVLAEELWFVSLLVCHNQIEDSFTIFVVFNDTMIYLPLHYSPFLPIQYDRSAAPPSSIYKYNRALNL